MKLKVDAASSEKLLKVRTMYVVQLLVSLASTTARNLEPLFQRFSDKRVLEQLALMDSCLLSYDSMNKAWQAALKDILVTGILDVKAVLNACEVCTVTGSAESAGLKTLGSGGGATEEDDDCATSSVFTFEALLTYGFSETDQLSAEQLRWIELQAEGHILETSMLWNVEWGKRLSVHLEKASAKGKLPPPEVLLAINLEEETCKGNILRFANSDMRMVKLPQDLKIYFSGSVGAFVGKRCKECNHDACSYAPVFYCLKL